jgi:Tol biopolymer transport system component
MPTKKPTRPERPRRPGAGPALSDRPASRPSGQIRPASGGSANRPDPKGPRKNNWRTLRENIGWGLVIGLPIILVILAILWRATNGFQPNPSDQPLPTVAPTVTAGAFIAPPAAPAGAKPDRILYIQAPAPDKPGQLYSANQDGSNPVQLTNSSENKFSPVWSPDGKQIAFAADGVGVQVVNFDGSGLHTLAYNGFSPVWSPDSTKIAFVKQETASDGRGPDNTGQVRILYVIDAKASAGQEKQLAYDATAPSWSPDGSQIAYFSLRNAVMFTIPAAGGDPTQIKTNGLGGWFPTFAPDGNSLIFYGAKNPAQFVAGLDFGSLTPAPTVSATTAPAPTATATATAAPSGTPGTAGPTATIVPTATPAPPAVIGLYQINKDGSNLKQLVEIENPPANSKDEPARFATYVASSIEATALLSNRPSYRAAPLFSPDGKYVAGLFAGIGHSTAGITLVPTGGGSPINIVSGENGLEQGTRLGSAFSADGSRLYYWFQATPGSNKQLRYFDINAKKEVTVISNGDNSFPRCCGFNLK